MSVLYFFVFALSWFAGLINAIFRNSSFQTPRRATVPNPLPGLNRLCPLVLPVDIHSRSMYNLAVILSSINKILQQKTASGYCQSPPFVIFLAVLVRQPLVFLFVFEPTAIRILRLLGQYDLLYLVVCETEIQECFIKALCLSGNIYILK